VKQLVSRRGSEKEQDAAEGPAALQVVIDWLVEQVA